MNQKKEFPFNIFALTKKESIALILLCVLPWMAVLFYLKHSFINTVFSLAVILAINVIYIYLFQLHAGTKIIAVFLKSLETLFVFLVLKTQGPFDLFLVLNNIEVVPDILSSSGTLVLILFFGALLVTCGLNYFVMQMIHTPFKRSCLLMLPLIALIVQKPQVYYPYANRVFTASHSVPITAFTSPTIAKNQSLAFQDDADVIFLHLEGLNSKVVNGDVLIDGEHYNTPAAPVFLEYAQRGTYFPGFYNTSVNTIRNQESLLCGIADNMEDYYAKRGGAFSFKCLPQIFKENGYATYFFKSDDLKFTNTGPFMKQIGFDIVAHREIMKQGDSEHHWGYVDDIFYQRTFEFLSRETSAKKFVYIAVAALNHYPYDNLEEYKHLRVYPDPKNFYERFANTTRQQDEMLRAFFRYFDQYGKKNTHLIVFGDHSVPVGINGSLSSFEGIYEDTHLTSMFYILPDGTSSPRATTNRYSHISLFHTILEKFAKDYTSNLSMPEITPNDLNQKTHYVRLNQPMGSTKSMAMVHFPHKWTYDFDSKETSYFNLREDPFEQTKTIIARQGSINQFEEIVKTGQTQGEAIVLAGAAPESNDQPQTPEDYLNTGVAYGQKGYHNIAIANFERALKMTPNDPSLYIMLGNAYMHLTAWDMASEKFQKAIAIDPGIQSEIAYLNLGVIYANNKKEYARAIDYLQKFVELTSDRSKASEIQQNIHQIQVMLLQTKQSFDGLNKALD